MRYAVLGEGQRIRPILAIRVARAVGAEHRLTITAAAAVELVHAASLVVDDLPCMDDAEVRRGRPAVHRRFGEATAVLAAFALVALAARSVLDEDSDRATLPRLVAFERDLLATLDCSSLIAGQALDLGIDRGHVRFDSAGVAALKTVPLFELAARAGLLFANVPAAARRELVQFGRDFGLAYQLVDDYLDGETEDLEPAASCLRVARGRLVRCGERARGLVELVDYLDARSRQENHGHR